MNKKILLFITLIVLRFPLFSQNTEQKRLFLNNMELEPWAMDISIRGNIVDLSNWGSMLYLRYNKNRISQCFGIEIEYDYDNRDKNYYEGHDFSISFGWTPLFYFNRKVVAPYLGTGLSLGMNICNEKVIAGNRLQYSIFPSINGVFGAEFNFSERFSLLFEYRMFFLIRYTMSNISYDEDNREFHFSFTATTFRFGLIIYF